MKRLRFLLLVVGGFFIFAALIGSLLPGRYDVQRSTTVSAPPQMVYEQVIDLRKHEAWAPWRKADPSYVFHYGDRTRGIGATMTWQGESSSGGMRIAKATPGRFIENRLHSPDMGETIGTWTFEPHPKGTHVTWRFRGDIAGPVGGWMAIFMDVMLAPFFEDGLKDLRRVAQAAKLPAEASASGR